ncbi:MAG: outer membrane beta-barrel protein [Thermoanaerobaculia bacterium]
MRKLLIVTALIVLCCSSLYAADASSGNQWRISVLASEISTGNNQPWSDDSQTGVGLGIAYAPVPEWDVELTVASKTHVSPYTRVFYVLLPEQQGLGQLYPVTEFRRYRATPLELTATRHFLTDGPIAPYVRAGVRYVSAPADPGPANTFIAPYPAIPVPNPGFFSVSEGFNLDDRTSAQVGAGARIRLTPRTAIRAEVNRLIRSDAADFDPLTRYAVGLSWLF